MILINSWSKYTLFYQYSGKPYGVTPPQDQWNKTPQEEQLLSYMNSDRMINFSAETMWVHGKYQSQMKRCV